ncbi:MULTISPECIES: hypothetical protein [unclassified Pyramidobacter]|nr:MULTISPECIES: hypothetical protein [unclassified Pyramidobacter]MCI7402976.1 hypothetical protein [Pyramidobacter sp.]MDY3211816.1 hypothetical protein [Pyramidobacter sp.]OON87757.1 hypothetical protein B0D78_09520 [Pyramidobacter sp. C12-8]WOL41309.1 hypothetical protein RAH42_05840 [Pyramidobacter sp. YE332]
MAMQISLDEVLSMLLSRVDAMAVANENMKSKFNILARALYKKGLLTDDDLVQSVKDEHKLLLDLGAIKEMPDDAALKSIADNMIVWIKNDAEAIRKNMKDYEAKVKAMIEEEEKKPRLDVASAADLQRLERMSGKKSGSGLIIP